MAKGLKRKWENDELGFNRVTNAQLTCADCIFRKNDEEILGNTSKCKKYSLKPSDVLHGGECKLKEPEED